MSALWAWTVTRGAVVASFGFQILKDPSKEAVMMAWASAWMQGTASRWAVRRSSEWSERDHRETEPSA